MARGNELPKDLVKFLDAADEDFIYAYETKRFGMLSMRFTRRANTIIQRMVAADGGTRYFGKRNMRTTTWELVDEEDGAYIIRKTCIYKRIHVTLFKTIKASEDYTCEWVVVPTSSLENEDNNYGWKVDVIREEEYLYGN